jgi:hypothetical protein
MDMADGGTLPIIRIIAHGVMVVIMADGETDTVVIIVDGETIMEVVVEATMPMIIVTEKEEIKTLMYVMVRETNAGLPQMLTGKILPLQKMQTQEILQQIRFLMVHQEEQIQFLVSQEGIQ